jgi:hypothetical protein
MTDNNENKSWWATLPGIMTATASLITAIGGLLVILNANGYLSQKQKVNSDTQTGENIYTKTKKEEKKAPLIIENETVPINDIKTFHLKGNVGKLQAVFNLTFNFGTKKIQGSYYYPARQNVVYEITGIISSTGIELTEFTSNVKTATCSLNNFDNCYNGQMYNINGKQYDMNVCKIDD